MIQKKVTEFFGTHPEATEVHVALGVLFVEPDKANQYLAGTQNQTVQTITKDEAVAWQETKINGTIPGDITLTGNNADMIDHEVTEEDIANNPEFKEQGISVGDIIQVPVKDDTGSGAATPPTSENEKLAGDKDKTSTKQKPAKAKDPAPKKA